MRTDFLGVEFDRLTKEELIDRLAKVGPDSPFGYVVTPNVDHIVKLERETTPGLKAIIANAAFCLCDSRILARLARLRGVMLDVIPGSDLTAALFDRVIVAGDRIALVGGNAVMAQQLQQRFPAIDFIHYQPPIGLLTNDRALHDTADFVVGQHARFAFLAVGFPQQELVAARIAANPAARGMALCVGASLEFLTGHQRRAPLAVQRLGLEWAHRLASNPARLWRRYLVEGPAIFRMAWQWRKL